MIEARSLGARLGAFALRDVTFTVPAGKYGVVIGPAGSGKTTLLEPVAGIIPTAAGELHLGGRDMRGIPPEQRGAGLLYQHGFLFPHLRVLENVRYGARDEATVRELVRRLDCVRRGLRSVPSLSGRAQPAFPRTPKPAPEKKLVRSS